MNKQPSPAGLKLLSAIAAQGGSKNYSARIKGTSIAAQAALVAAGYLEETSPGVACVSDAVLTLTAKGHAALFEPEDNPEGWEARDDALVAAAKARKAGK